MLTATGFFFWPKLKFPLDFLRDRLSYDFAYNRQVHTFILIKSPPAIL